jgi:hypothetical protein
MAAKSGSEITPHSRMRKMSMLTDQLADYLEPTGSRGIDHVIHPHTIISTLVAMRGPPAKVGKRLLSAWHMTNRFWDCRRHDTATLAGIVRISASVRGTSGTFSGGRSRQVGFKGNGIGRDVAAFRETRTLMAAAKAEIFTPEAVQAINNALSEDQISVLAACAGELAARATFIAAFLPECLPQMAVAQRKRTELVAPAFAGLAVRLASFAATPKAIN